MKTTTIRRSDGLAVAVVLEVVSWERLVQPTRMPTGQVRFVTALDHTQAVVAVVVEATTYERLCRRLLYVTTVRAGRAASPFRCRGYA